jgi:plasmid stabilization system protein ParE
VAYSLRIAAAAQHDLKGVRRWLTQPGAGRDAAERLRHIRRAVRELGRDPLMWPESDHAGYRARSVEQHKIIYRIMPGDLPNTGLVEVIRVFAPRQNQNVL